MVVYHIEIGLLFVTLAALGPLVRAGARYSRPKDSASAPIGLAEFPG
jgi:BCD family chlorophyll transporter-like MFS transporter